MVRACLIDEIGAFDTNLDQGEDVDFLMRAAAMSQWTIEGVNKVWVAYHCRENSLSSNLSALDIAWVTLMKRASKMAPELVQLYSKSVTGQFYRKQARRALRPGGNTAQAVQYMARAFKADPFLILRSPRRTVLTLLGVCLALMPFHHLKEIVR